MPTPAMPAPVIRPGASSRDIAAALRQAQHRVSPPDVRRHLGVLSLREDPRETQRRMRSEWDERPR